MEAERREELERRPRRMAKRRASFKIHLRVYLVIIAVCWIADVVLNFALGMTDNIWLW